MYVYQINLQWNMNLAQLIDSNFISEEEYQERKTLYKYNCIYKLDHSNVERN